MSDKRRIIVCPDPESLARRAVDLMADTAAEAVRKRGRFTCALAGGSTPENVYKLLAAPQDAGRIDWAKAYLFMGDERYVPHNDPRSNFGMVKRTLLTGVSVPASNVFPIPTDLPSPAACADACAVGLQKFFEPAPEGGFPRFDLILLGMGDDGHTASLFPGAAALAERRAWVTWSPPGQLPPPVDRVTLTFPVLNAARKVVFLVAGEKKADMVCEVLEKNPPVERRPSAGVQPEAGDLIWLLDAAAARLLKKAQ